MSKLTPKQEKFAQEYVRTGNKSEAYRLAYDIGSMPNESIHVRANEVSNNSKVSVRIRELKKQLETKALYTLEESVKSDLRLKKRYEDALDILGSSESDAKQIETAERTIKHIGASGYSQVQDRLSRQHGFYEPDNNQRSIVNNIQLKDLVKFK